ncbi:MAG: type II toxin-antitoxin system VapC family toxin, partial [Planctomycetota bacterium]
MRFWDSSAVLAVVLSEPGPLSLAPFLDGEAAGALWRLTSVEVRSALSRRVRERALEPGAAERIWSRFLRLRTEFLVVDQIHAVAERAESLLVGHALRAADALQLAAALLVREAAEVSLEFVTLDRRLAKAAAAEGFVVLPPPTGEGRVAERTRRPR